MDKEAKFSFLLRNLHLIGGVAFVIALIMGLVMEEIDRGEALFQVMFFHKSIGLAVLGLVAFRLLEWVRTSQPKGLESHSRWEQQAAKLVKIGLYVVMIALPVSGLLMSWFKGYPGAFFGLFDLPPLVAKDEGLHEVFEEIHEALVPATFLLLGLHVGGALKHHFLDRDGTLLRIAPFSKG